MGNAIVLPAHLLAKRPWFWGVAESGRCGGEYPSEAATLGLASFSETSAQSSLGRPFAFWLLHFIPEPSSAVPHSHHPPARYAAALSSGAQGFQISLYLLFEAQEEARSQRARTGTAPSHLRTQRRNPRFGCPKIAQHLAKTFGLELNKDVVRRVLAAHCRPDRNLNGLRGLRFWATPKTAFGA
jgi:hypothetical protein